jgi:hypothetical protein
MKKTIFNLMQKVMEHAPDDLNAYASALGVKVGEQTVVAENTFAESDLQARLDESREFMWAQLTGKNYKGEAVSFPEPVPYKESVSSADFSIVIPRVINNVLQEPTEPDLVLQNMIAEQIELPYDSPNYIEFPYLGAFTAEDMAEGQQYQTQTLGIGQGRISLKIGKIGLAAALTDEIIRLSMWPLVNLHLKAMANAINRKKEANLYAALLGEAQEVYDNDDTDTAKRTTGVGTAQTWNGSFSYFDLIHMWGTMIGLQKNPTHVLAHPLMWSVFSQDPYLMGMFMFGGQIGGNVWSRPPAFDQQSNMFFNIQYLPYYAIPFTENGTLTLSGSGLGAASYVSDIYMIDKANSLYQATRGPIEMDQMEDWFADGRVMKARQYYGTAVKDGGKGILVARNVRAVRNYEPLYTVRSVSS